MKQVLASWDRAIRKKTDEPLRARSLHGGEGRGLETARISARSLSGDEEGQAGSRPGWELVEAAL